MIGKWHLAFARRAGCRPTGASTRSSATVLAQQDYTRARAAASVLEGSIALGRRRVCVGRARPRLWRNDAPLDRAPTDGRRALGGLFATEARTVGRRRPRAAALPLLRGPDAARALCRRRAAAAVAAARRRGFDGGDARSDVAALVARSTSRSAPSRARSRREKGPSSSGFWRQRAQAGTERVGVPCSEARSGPSSKGHPDAVVRFMHRASWRRALPTRVTRIATSARRCWVSSGRRSAASTGATCGRTGSGHPRKTSSSSTTKRPAAALPSAAGASTC